MGRYIMKVLVAGGSGLLGGELSRQLRMLGYTVIVHSMNTAGDAQCDLTDLQSTIELIKEIKPDCIINLVALTNVDKCEIDLHSAYLLNVRVVENIAYAIANSGIHLVQISTDHVYDGVGIQSECQIKLTNTYALTKYAGEIAASLVNGTVLRTNFFGPSALPGRLSISDWVLSNLRSGAPFNAFSDVIFNPLSMHTLCKMIAVVINMRIPGVFNLGSRFPQSKAEFALQLVFGLRTDKLVSCSVDSMSLPAYRPKNMSMDCSSFERSFEIILPTLSDEIHTLNRNI